MTRIAKVENTSVEDVKVKLVGGPEITLKPGTSLENVDIEEVSSLKGKTKVTEDLTEVNSATGQMRLFG